MLMCFRNTPQKYVFIIDTEYDDKKVLQFAGLFFKRIDEKNHIYQLIYSINDYIKQDDDINKYITYYTGLDKIILNYEGIDWQDFIKKYNKIFKDVQLKNTVLVAHGCRNDRKVLKQNGLILPSHSYCTYKNAQKLLGREKHLKLKDIAAEAGFQLRNTHNAYDDALATVAAFSYLKNIEFQNKRR